MRKKILALSAFNVAVVILIIVLFVQFQFSLIKENNDLKAENYILQDLADERRVFYYEKIDLESQNDELIEHLGNLTKQLALARPLRVEIVSFSHEDQWGYGTFLGVERASLKFNVTIRNNDSVALSGIELSADIYSGFRPVGWGSGKRFDLLLAGGEQTFGWSLTMSFGEPTADLSLLVTLKSGDVILDELRLSGIASPF